MTRFPKFLTPAIVLTLALAVLAVARDEPKATEPDTAAAPGQVRAVGSAEARRAWMFCPSAEPEIPEISKKSWPRNPIDCFILATLENRTLKPVGDADRRTLIRRANSFTSTSEPLECGDLSPL